MNHQARAILAAGVTLAAASSVLTAGAAATKLPPARAALATGGSRGGGASFRLEGRKLTIEARDGLVPGSHQARLRLLVRCGESVAAPEETSAATLAVQGGRRVDATTRRKLLTVTLSRDVAARANWCELRDLAASRSLYSATMRVRRGTPPGCVPAGRERVVFRHGRAIVTELSSEVKGDRVFYYRVCMLARRSLAPLTSVGSVYADNSALGAMASHGRWLAWTRSARDRYDNASVSVAVLDLAAANGPVSASVGGFSGQTAYVPRISDLLVSDAGVAVWTLVQRYDDPTRPEWATLYAGREGSEERQLDSAEPAAGLTDVAIGADGATVTWRNGGVERSAPLTG